jgi:catechol 2,3-dioxygenase-like lactoylglutathione lyase family enzyme
MSELRLGEMTLGKTTPILRIFDEAKAREFYVDFLGFKVDWEHRFEPGKRASHRDERA